MKDFLCGMYGVLAFFSGASTIFALFSAAGMLFSTNVIAGEAIYWLIGSALLTWLFGETHFKLGG